MKTKLFGLLALLLMLCTVAMSAKKVHTLGDSTMAPYDESATVTRGWGMYFGNRPGTDGLDKSLTETVTYNGEQIGQNNKQGCHAKTSVGDTFNCIARQQNRLLKVTRRGGP